MVVPIGTAISTPLWFVEDSAVGAVRLPNFDDIRPVTGFIPLLFIRFRYISQTPTAKAASVMVIIINFFFVIFLVSALGFALWTVSP